MTDMQSLLTLSAAALVLAVAIGSHEVAALSPGAREVNQNGLVQKLQKGGEPITPSPIPGEAAERRKGSAGREQGTNARGPTVSPR